MVGTQGKVAFLALGLVVAGACSQGAASPSPIDDPDAAAPRVDGGGRDASAEAEDGAATPDGSFDAVAVDAHIKDAAAGPTTLRVHYPAGGHAVTIRGSAPGLSWQAGQSAPGSGDTYTYVFSSLAGPAEWKPLLDDATWARGPNYHVSPGETVDVWPHFTAASGQVVTLIASFHSNVLGNDRPIYAYLPASYAENTGAAFPVVYMHDGQNLWASHPELAGFGTWNVDTAFDDAAEHGACSANNLTGWSAQPLGGTATRCASDGDCPSGECRTFPEAIVIGISNIGTSRIHEYTPTTDPTTPGGGGADAYLDMIVTELKPRVDAMLRTRPDVASTAMSGSSLGGLVSAYAGTKYADIFGRLAELSPSTWWNNDGILATVSATPASPRPLVVYVDSGQGSADDEADTNMLAQAYLSLGYMDGQTFRHVVQPGAAHNETYWSQRFPGAMQLTLGAR